MFKLKGISNIHNDFPYFLCWAYIVPLDIKGCICNCENWQIHPFISKGTTYCLSRNLNVSPGQRIPQIHLIYQALWDRYWWSVHCLTTPWWCPTSYQQEQTVFLERHIMTAAVANIFSLIPHVLLPNHWKEMRKKLGKYEDLLTSFVPCWGLFCSSIISHMTWYPRIKQIEAILKHGKTKVFHQ